MIKMTELIIKDIEHFTEMLYHLDQIYALNCDKPENNNALVIRLCKAELKSLYEQAKSIGMITEEQAELSPCELYNELNEVRISAFKGINNQEIKDQLELIQVLKTVINENDGIFDTVIDAYHEEMTKIAEYVHQRGYIKTKDLNKFIESSDLDFLIAKLNDALTVLK